MAAPTIAAYGSGDAGSTMKRPLLMGILNVTPDSFSDGYASTDAAIRQFHHLVSAGADIIDIGAESTRPGAKPLTPDEEWVRLAPVLSMVTSYTKDVQVSVDTRHALTAARALDLGVCLINDVGGLTDTTMRDVLANHMGDIVVMHSLSIPADPDVLLAVEADVVTELLAWKASIIQRAEASGIDASRLIFDPGIGFGKTAEQSQMLCLRAAELAASGGRWLFGHSRKSFLNIIQQLPANERDGLTRAISLLLANAGINYLRVHDVSGHHAMFECLCT